mmetsp:Transcript_22492/g.50680  ORF Transcript_22492/g.50680 Transcript_22492/m.50680 type:complete len:520 (-) Transcript_22492:59-1618(-)
MHTMKKSSKHGSYFLLMLVIVTIVAIRLFLHTNLLHTPIPLSPNLHKGLQSLWIRRKGFRSSTQPLALLFYNNSTSPSLFVRNLSISRPISTSIAPIVSCPGSSVLFNTTCLCKEGYQGENGRPPCTICKAGTFAPSRGQHQCLPCAWSPSLLEGQTSCEKCVNETLNKRVLIFTMDSLKTTLEAVKSGGPAGEIFVRTSLETVLTSLGFKIDVADHDSTFATLSNQALEAKCNFYRFFIMDPWTWIEKTPNGASFRARPILEGRQRDIFILDFFGNKDLSLAGVTLAFPKEQRLSAFPTNFGGSFLGFFYSQETLQQATAISKMRGANVTAGNTSSGDGQKQQGVVWGKKSEYFEKGQGIISAVLEKCDLVSFLPNAGSVESKFPRLYNLGYKSKEEFRQILAGSKFLLGLGDPLSGPSALDAMLVGVMYLNPSFPQRNSEYPDELKSFYTSQHPYMAQHGGNYVCSFDMLSRSMPDKQQLHQCVDKALRTKLEPQIPRDFTREEYEARVRRIFTRYM